MDRPDSNDPLYKTYAHLSRSGTPFSRFALQQWPILQKAVRRYYSGRFHRWIDSEDFAQEILIRWWGIYRLHGDEAANMTAKAARSACLDCKRRIRAAKRGSGQELTFSQAGICGDEAASRVLEQTINPSGKVPKRPKSDGPDADAWERRAYERVESVGLPSTSALARQNMMAPAEAEEGLPPEQEDPLWNVPADLPGWVRHADAAPSLEVEALLWNEHLDALTEVEALAFLHDRGILPESRTQAELARDQGVTPRTIRNRVRRAERKLQGASEPSENGDHRLSAEKAETG